MPEDEIPFAVDQALDKAALEQSTMTEEAILLRDSINKKLAKKGYHLRVSFLMFTEDEMRWDYIEPMDEWAMELQEIDSIIQEMIVQARRHH